MKRLIKKLILVFSPILLLLFRLFFDKKYLQGKWFESNIGGYIFSIKSIWVKNILRLAPPMPFPTALTCTISSSQNIHFHPDDINNFQSPGTYFQNFKGHIYIGRGSYIAPNVGIITANHKLDNLDAHTDGKDVRIGEKCWIGMNSVILPGVVLGDSTIVAAGSVVTKSFLQGGVIVAGAPAQVIKEIKE